MLGEAGAKLAALHDAQREALQRLDFEGPLARSDNVLAKSAAPEASPLKLRAPRARVIAARGDSFEGR